MPITFTPTVINQYYKVRLTQRDFFKERAKKVSFLYNAGNAGNLQSAFRVYEAASEAGITIATASQELLVSDWSTTTTSAGQNAKINDVLVLGFYKSHPLNDGLQVEAYFGIRSPVNAIIDLTGSTVGVGKPIMERGIDFATAASVVEGLGALVDWLENALVFKSQEPAGENLYAGGWTFDMGLSGMVSNPRNIGGLDLA